MQRLTDIRKSCRWIEGARGDKDATRRPIEPNNLVPRVFIKTKPQKKKKKKKKKKEKKKTEPPIKDHAWSESSPSPTYIADMKFVFMQVP
jgi:hypothetical protein